MYCEKSRYLTSIVDDSVILCDEIINVTDSTSIDVINIIPTSVTKSHRMDCFILHMAY